MYLEWEAISSRWERGPKITWDFDLFQHPVRLQREHSPRYIKTYDVYNLGAVLLEIVFWKSLRDVGPNLEESDLSNWPTALSEIDPNMSAGTGERYQRLVMQCLGSKGDYIVRDKEFVEAILDPLEDMVNALS